MTPPRLRFERILAAAIVAAVMSVSSAHAQSVGRVIRDGTVIWRADVSVPAATAKAGTVLDVMAQSEGWYEVMIPADLGGRGERGLIAIGSVQLLPGTPAPPIRTRAATPSQNPQPRPPTPQSTAAAQRTPPRPAVPEPAIGVRGFGQAAYLRLNARNSFAAVLGDANGHTFGGGAHVRFRNGLFAEVSWERFQRTGERVFVFDETVFRLGIPNTLTLTPARVSGGYRFRSGRKAVPYLGAGVGTYRLQETTPFTDPEEEFDERFTGYHALGGVEFRASRWIAAGVELEYASVPNALGLGGVSELYDENNLGGIQLRLKLLVGR